MWIVAIGLLASLLVAAPRLEAQRTVGRQGVATENATASREALAQLTAGGNAIDAMVTAALVGGVASPTSSGIGGGGFAVVWIAAEKKAYVVDFRETAPKAIDPSGFESRPFPDGERAALTGVPGEVAGLWMLHERWGKRPWKELVEPAVRTARSGYPLSKHTAAMTRYFQKQLMGLDAGLRELFYPGGTPLSAGRRVKNPKLASTLEAIAARGPKAFYEGAIAADVVASARKLGGKLTAAELASYKPVERQPLHVRWAGHDVYTMPPPSAGGLMLVQALKLYDRAYLRKLGDDTGAYQHMLAESMRASIADRMRHLGDPDHAAVDTTRLVSDARMKKRRAKLALDRTHGIPRFGMEEHGTHHLVTADSAGNVVSLTTTVNRVFGAKITADSSGVVLNDELDDFTAKKHVAPFGMSESPNRPRPGARPVSSMTPTIVVKDGKVVFAVGGSGGTTIATNVAQTVVSRLAFGTDPAKLVSRRRFYVPFDGAYISLEKGAPKELRTDLERRGEIVGEQRFNSSAVQVIAIEDGRVRAASDPRKHGSALAR